MSTEKTKARPISFSGSMVRALLDGTKTQTRRVMKLQPKNDPIKHHPIAPYQTPYGNWNWVLSSTGHGVGGDPFPCPYGNIGNFLWVKECWQAWADFDDVPPSKIPSDSDILYTVDRPNTLWDSRKRNLRFMPRWASRMTLEIMDVRVERLQEISLYDAQCEGIDVGPLSSSGARNEYGALWTSLKGQDSWNENPWVWVIDFKVHKCNVSALLIQGEVA
jgi:hypothetical protein